MDDNDGVNKYFNNFQNKYSTFKNVHFVEKKENENINKLIHQKVEHINPILEHLGNLYDNEQGEINKKTFINLKLGKKERTIFKKAFKDIFSKFTSEEMFHNPKNSIYHNNRTSFTQAENFELNNMLNYEGYNSSPNKSKKLNIHKRFLVPLKKKSYYDGDSKEKSSITNSPTKSKEKDIKKLNILRRDNSSQKSIISEENIVKSIPSFPLIDTKIGKNTLDTFIKQSNNIQKKIKITSKINNSISSSFLRKTENLVKEFIIEDDPIEKPILRRKVLQEFPEIGTENNSNYNKNIRMVNLKEEMINNYRVEAFDKIANLNDQITYKYGDFIIKKYGYEIQKKKYLFNPQSKSNTNSPKKLNFFNTKLTFNNHKKIENLLDLTKTKKTFLVDQIEKKIFDYNK
jgi:hypothetical protein